MPDKEILKQLQSLPLDAKIITTIQRVREWVTKYGINHVYLSLSGGKDSCVLLDIIKDVYPEIKCVFCNTGLEFPEIQTHVKQLSEVYDIDVVYPEQTFIETIRKNGYPMFSKMISHQVSIARNSPGGNVATKLFTPRTTNTRYNFYKWRPMLNVDFKLSDRCCVVNKERPLKRYANTHDRYPITAQMTDESQNRLKTWLQHGCNMYDAEEPMCNPMSFWKTQDVLQYICCKQLKIASVYGDVIKIDDKYTTTGYNRTGCIYCGFGSHLGNDDRFVQLKNSHPLQYNFCMGGGEYDIDGLWKPNKKGLGMLHVIQVINSIYGDDFIKI